MDSPADSQDLIEILCTRIGMIMEDMSLAALTIGPLGDPARSETIDDLEHAATRITALVGAVRALGG